MTQSLTIESLGHQGDGLATTPNGRVFVPFTLPGERVEVSPNSARRELIKVLDPSAHRIEPICRYFGICGGCQVQHFSHQPYLEWKRSLVAEALAGENIEAEIHPVEAPLDDKRRRAVFSAMHSSDGVIFGFTQKSSHKITDIIDCPIISQPIASRIGAIKKIIRPVLPAKGSTSIYVLACDNGLDIHVEASGNVNENSRRSAIRFALEENIARLSYGNEILVEINRPRLKSAIASVCVPPGMFVQALASVEQKMADLVSGHLGGCKQVADLFCGIGTFALRLAQHSTVIACESNQVALDALDEAWRATGGKLKLIQTEKRDLFLRPMMADELKKIQGVVFDPPRAGAPAQARQLARSKVKKIAAISCNPATLAQDLAILIDGGFKLTSVFPFDQFVFTPHVEVVALLERQRS